MHKLRLLLLLGLMFAVGGTLVANGQKGTSVSNDQDKKSDSKHEKTKNNANDGHRRHWWSPPHSFHKKHDNTAGGEVKHSDNKTVAVENKPVANPVAAATSTKKSATAPHPGTKTVATPGEHKGTVAEASPHRKAVSGTTQAKKTVKPSCTPEQARKTGCHLDKGSDQKGSAPSSPGKSS